MPGGAPSAAREVYLYNPPIVNEELGIRASSLKQAVNLAGDLVLARVPTIVFAPSRNSVEVMLKYLRDRVGEQLPPDAIMGYRGGYLPETRRARSRARGNASVVPAGAAHAVWPCSSARATRSISIWRVSPACCSMLLRKRRASIRATWRS